MGQQQCCENINNQKHSQLAYKFQNLHQHDPKQSSQGLLPQSTASSSITQTNTPSTLYGEFLSKPPQLNSQVAMKIQQKCSLEIPGIVKLEHGEEDFRYFKFKQTGIIYRGEWLVSVLCLYVQNGKPYGWGQNYYPNGGYYEGSFVQGIPHGFGRLILSSGDYYIGSIKYGRANGNGQFKTPTGNYKGQFKDNLRHGHGNEQTSDSHFLGSYQYGQKRKGILQFNHNEDLYDGEFEDDVFHGKGKLISKQGVYVGEFRNGYKCGYGEFKWKDGSWYRGNYSQGQRDGDGEFYNGKNKTTSRGIWKNGTLQGSGQYIEKGKVYKCIWTNGKLTSLRN